MLDNHNISDTDIILSMSLWMLLPACLLLILLLLLCYCDLLARDPEYPERIRVASVVETFVLCLSAWKQIFSFSFSSPPLL